MPPSHFCKEQVGPAILLFSFKLLSLSPLGCSKLTICRPSDRWINSLPNLFEQCDLKVLDHVTQAPLPMYRKPWNEDCLIGWAAIGDRIRDENEKQWYKERLAEAANNAKRGWYVDWELVVCVAKKAS